MSANILKKAGELALKLLMKFSEICEQGRIGTDCEEFIRKNMQTKVNELEAQSPWTDLKAQQQSAIHLSESKEYASLEQCMTDLARYEMTNGIEPQDIATVDTHKSFWEKQFASASGDPIELAKIHHAMLTQWGEDIAKREKEWIFRELETFEQDLEQRSTETLEALSDINDTMCELGFPGIGGFTDLDFSDMETIKLRAKMLKEDKQIAEIIDKLGHQMNNDRKERTKQVVTTLTFESDARDVNSREEVVGICLGADITNVLPQELALLQDPELVILFDKKLVDRQLLCFDMEGMMANPVEHKKFKNESTKRGDMILCIDTSGSMQGFPEEASKAVALFMACKARAEKRKCLLLNFTDESNDKLDLAQPGKMGSLIDFLSKSFNGGTDVSPALCEAVSEMQKENYAKADALVISDMIIPDISQPTIDKMDELREYGNKFYGLFISTWDYAKYTNPKAEEYFDEIYKYEFQEQETPQN